MPRSPHAARPRRADRAWKADPGQFQLDLEGAPESATPTATLVGADHWYDIAVDLEGEDPAGAMAAYGTALALEPDHAEAHLNLGRLLHEAGRLPEAERHYRAALASDPRSARASYNLGVALEDQGRGAAAAAAYEVALRLDSALAAAHFNLSRLHEAAGRRTDALRHLADYRRLLGRTGPAD